MKAIFDAYSNFSKKDLEQAIESEASGSLRKVLLAIGMTMICKFHLTYVNLVLFIVRVMRSRPVYFAHQLKKALKVRIFCLLIIIETSAHCFLLVLGIRHR